MININFLRVITVFTLICLTFTFGCSQNKTEKASETSKDKITLRIGLIPEQNIFAQLSRYKNIGDYLEKKTNINIKFKALTKYGDIVKDFKKLQLDGAFFGSFIYAIAHSKLGVIPLARPESPDGSSTYHGIIFVRNDSGINGVHDMKGKTFAFVDKATTAGYLLPLYYFKHNGITDYNKFFKKTYFTGTHADAVYDVLNKNADIGAAKNTIFYRLVQKDPRIANELKILSRSPDVPENALALSKNIDEKIRNKIKETLLDMNNDPVGKKVLKAFGAVKFIETNNKDYQSVYDYADEIGLDLKTFDYTHE